MEVDEAADGVDVAFLGVDGQLPEAADAPCLLQELADSAWGRGGWLRVPSCMWVLRHSWHSKAILPHYPTNQPVLFPGAPCGIIGRRQRYAAGCGIIQSWASGERS